MIKAKDALAETLRKTLLIQAALTLAAAFVALLVNTPSFALALSYGGAVTMAGTAVHAWRLLKIVTQDVDKDPDLMQGNAGTEMFLGAVFKLGTIVGLLAIGMGVIKLDALAVLIGFITAYIGFFFASGYARRSR